MPCRGLGGQSVESREQFLELGAEKIFTQELMDSVAAADETKLEPSMAGFVLAQEREDHDRAWRVPGASS